MTERELRSIRDHIENCLLDGIVKQLMIRLTPIVEKVNLLVGGQRDLADRVKSLEAVIERQRDDIAWLLRAECSKKDPMNNPWGKIDTSQVAVIDD